MTQTTLPKQQKKKEKSFPSIHSRPPPHIPLSTSLSPAFGLSLNSLPLRLTLFWLLKSTCDKVLHVMLCIIYICVFFSFFVFFLAIWTSIFKFGQVSFSEYEVRPDVDLERGTGVLLWLYEVNQNSEFLPSQTFFFGGVVLLICEPISPMFTCMIDGSVTNLDSRFNYWFNQIVDTFN